MLTQIDHIGIAVFNIARSLALFRDLFGFKELSNEIAPDGTVRVAFLEVGTTKLELIEPLDNPGVSRFLEKRGEGLHHICFRSTDLHGDLEQLRQKGATIIDAHPRRGAHGMMVAFVHPHSVSGVLIELAQPEAEYTRLRGA